MALVRIDPERLSGAALRTFVVRPKATSAFRLTASAVLARPVVASSFDPMLPVDTSEVQRQVSKWSSRSARLLTDWQRLDWPKFSRQTGASRIWQSALLDSIDTSAVGGALRVLV
jgi:hypothetical protein